MREGLCDVNDDVRIGEDGADDVCELHIDATCVGRT